MRVAVRLRFKIPIPAETHGVEVASAGVPTERIEVGLWFAANV
jgi:hypothetical protein